MSKDVHGDRMKYYEGLETNQTFMKGLPIYARLDGRGFSKFTKVFDYPHDTKLRQIFTEVCKHLVKEFNCDLAFHQSDEISLLIAKKDELGNINTGDIILGGKKQKLTSLMAAEATGAFIINALKIYPEHTEHVLNNVPTFDCRVFNVPSVTEGINQFVWRERDCTKNSISMLGRAYFSHKELHNKNLAEIQDLLYTKNVNWNDMPTEFKRGTYIKRVTKPVIINGTEVLRSFIEPFDVPPIVNVVNKEGVLLRSEEPLYTKDKLCTK